MGLRTKYREHRARKQARRDDNEEEIVNSKSMDPLNPPVLPVSDLEFFSNGRCFGLPAAEEWDHPVKSGPERPYWYMSGKEAGRPGAGYAGTPHQAVAGLPVACPNSTEFYSFAT